MQLVSSSNSNSFYATGNAAVERRPGSVDPKHNYVPRSVPCGLVDIAPFSSTSSVMDMYLVYLVRSGMKPPAILRMAEVARHTLWPLDSFTFRNKYFCGLRRLKGWITKTCYYNFLPLASCRLKRAWEHSWNREKNKGLWWNPFLLPVVEIKTFCDLQSKRRIVVFTYKRANALIEYYLL